MNQLQTIIQNFSNKYPKFTVSFEVLKYKN